MGENNDEIVNVGASDEAKQSDTFYRDYPDYMMGGLEPDSGKCPNTYCWRTTENPCNQCREIAAKPLIAQGYIRKLELTIKTLRSERDELRGENNELWSRVTRLSKKSIAERRLEALQRENEKLKETMRPIVNAAIEYLEYEHDGDPWTEDARAMGEMAINEIGIVAVKAAREALTPNGEQNNEI